MGTVQIALSEKSIQKVVKKAIDNFHVTKSGASNGRFRASYNLGVKLHGGTVDLQNNPDEIKISELDVVYDPLNVKLEIDIPEMCVGGFCIIPNPFGGCILRAPKICIFSANPDISIPINLDGLIESEISGGFKPEIKFFDNPANAGMNEYQAHANNVADEWQLFLKVNWLDFDLIDISDTVGNILDKIIDNFIDGIFGGLPGWAKSMLSWILHGISDIIRGILDIVDDIDEWFSDLLGVSFGIFDFILTEVANYFLKKTPLYQLPTPYPIMPGTPPVLLAIKQLGVDIDATEMILNIEV
jgi:hypothetical protein